MKHRGGHSQRQGHMVRVHGRGLTPGKGPVPGNAPDAAPGQAAPAAAPQSSLPGAQAQAAPDTEAGLVAGQQPAQGGVRNVTAQRMAAIQNYLGRMA